MDILNNDNSLNELDDIFGDLEASLGNDTSKLEDASGKQSYEGFACLFPEWDLKPVRK